MKIRATLMSSLFVCGVALFGPGEQAHAQAAASDPSAIVLANLPGPTGGVEWGRAEGIVEARPDDVLAILRDYAAYAGLFPHFEQSKVLSQRGSDAIVYLEAKVLHGAATLWGQVRISQVERSGIQVVEAKMMRGKSNIEQLLARWEVTAIDNGTRTLVAFQLLVDPGLPVPDALVNSELKNSAGKALRALRKRAGERSVIAARPTHQT